jgi:ADP-ribose pyrophosphatase YjhB (NUDIX family)
VSFPFNVRVYGALVHQGHILLSDEVYRGFAYTKLPGGGLEHGEGLRDALVREFKEEADLDVRTLEHLYTTDFFQASAFNPQHQVISVYYRVAFAHTPQVLTPPVALVPGHVLRWKNLSDLSDADFTFPIDRQLVPLLRALA